MSNRPMGETYYEILGVSTDATAEEIHAAYRERLKETHPDVSDEADASDRTKLLIEAKEVLTDETERARYDRLGHDQYVNGTIPPGSSQTDGKPGRDRQQSRESATTRESTRRSARRAEQTTTGAANGGTAASASWYGGGGSQWEGSASETADNRWQAWNADRPYAVQGQEEGLLWSRLFPVSQSVILLATTFLIYPLLLAGTVAPPFPLFVKFILGGCLLGIVVYLQTIPEVGMVVFGAWTVLLPAILWGWLGVSPVTILSGVVLVATVLPLGLSALTRAVIRP